MALIAKYVINTGSRSFKPGELVTGLSLSEENRLITLGAAESTNREIDVSSNSNQFEVLEQVLHKMIKRELIAYGTELELEVDEKMRNDELISLIMSESRENGIDISAFEEKHLHEFAELAGIERSTSFEKEVLLDAIEERFA